MQSRCRARLLTRCWLLAALLLTAGTALGATGTTELQRLRSLRREAMRARSLSAEKSGEPARFGLLVIPVDFADARLPAGWEPGTLSPRLVPDRGESLHNYFRVASGGRLDLSIIVAPVVHLPEPRRQYSDRDLNGFTRTRKLATESITAVRDLGLEFRRLDLDGPDGIAGTDDDDGQVDGVLILHAGIGNENDPGEGLIQALQFFLAEPVESRGVTASFYAVASLQSGPGIWAHETAHLLGLEDRYDPILHPSGGSEVQSVGGLGRFSLMSSGAWGTGGGWGAALPDAYSAVQMGWRTAHNLAGTGTSAYALSAGEAARVWTNGAVGPEFFLLETRDPAASAPFDAAVPGGGLLIYHVDENLPEGAWHEDGPYQWHLRARLVEADGDRGLATGEDDGGPDDLFPGSLGVTGFGPFTLPASDGYYSGPSLIALNGIAVGAGGMVFRVALDTGPAVAFDCSFVGEEAVRPLQLTVTETGAAIASLRGQLRALSNAENGAFVANGLRAVTFNLVENSPGVWVPDRGIAWQTDPAPDAGASTLFEIRIAEGGQVYALENREWAWRTPADILDFRENWPGQWRIDHPDENLDTTWHRWEGAPWLTSDQSPVLACTGAGFTDPGSWPAVTYGNGAHTTLTSGPLDSEAAAVRMVHAIEVEMLTGLTGMDGGVVRWVGPDGQEQHAVSLAGYSGSIASRSSNPLHGQAAFVAPELALDGDVVRWRVDTFPLPPEPGPWRLRLVFGANRLWRARGWFVADLEVIRSESGVVEFVPRWTGDLVWPWPWDTRQTLLFQVETRPDAETDWQQILTQDVAPDAAGLYRIPGSQLSGIADLGPRHRHQIRIVGKRPPGEVASRPVVLYPDGGDGRTAVMGTPWPNPARGEVRLMLDIPLDRSATLRVYNVRGQLVSTRRFAAGGQLVVWDGQTTTGARAPAGPYFLRLEGTGQVLTRKVVLLH